MTATSNRPLKITHIEDHGTLVRVFAQDDAGVEVITFDHRPFWSLWEAEGGNLLDRWIAYDGEQVRLLD